jgi:hypothetical protein
MTGGSLDKKYEQAAQVVCRQGIVPFPVNDTTISILKHVIEDDEEELEFINAFREQPSQTVEQVSRRRASSSTSPVQAGSWSTACFPS